MGNLSTDTTQKPNSVCWSVGCYSLLSQALRKGGNSKCHGILTVVGDQSKRIFPAYVVTAY